MLQVAFFSFVLYNIFLRLCHWKSSKSSVKQSKRELTNDTSHFRSELKIWYNSWTKKRSTRKRICQVASMTLCNLLTNTFFSIQKLLLIGAVSPTGSAKHGDKSLIALGLKKWNQLPSNVKSLISITKLKEYIRPWFGPCCKCNICRI